MRVIRDLAVSVGEFQDSQGQTKKKWQNVGVMMKDDQDKDRVCLKFHMPLPMKMDNDGYPVCWVNVYPLKPKQGQQPNAQEVQQPAQQQQQGQTQQYNNQQQQPAQQTQQQPTTQGQYNGGDDSIDDIPF